MQRTLIVLCVAVAACSGNSSGKSDRATDRDPSTAGGSNDDAGGSSSGGGAQDGSVQSDGDSSANTSDAGNSSPAIDGGPTDVPALRKALLDKAYACNVVDDVIPGTFNLGKIQDDYDVCAATCIVGASCDNVLSLYCNPGQKDMLTACIDRCPMHPANGFKCADGSKIPRAFVCDLLPGDCPGGDDEGKHCGTHSCDDGQVLKAEDVHCNAVPDCDDGSDELRCSFTCGGGRTFDCKNGRRIASEYVCDGESDCDDGGDEQGCPPNFTCDFGGTSIRPSLVCDGEDNCFDGADEKNCP